VGAKYRLGQRVLQVLPDEQGVTVVTDQRSYRAQSVVLASGFGSPLTRQLGLGLAPDHVSGIQALVASNDITNVEIYLGQEVAPGFFSWVVPTAPGQALVGLLARRKAPVHMVNFLRVLRGSNRITRVIKEPSCWGIPLRPLKRTYRDRVLVVGDAAGQVKPTTGGGIYYSLLASEIAVGVLGQALIEDDLSAGNLSQYQSSWKSLLSQELETGYSARRFYEFLSDQQINSLIRQADANGVYQDLSNCSDTSFDWHSQVIGKLMNHPGLCGVLRLVNPLLARFAPCSDIPVGLTLATSNAMDSVPQPQL
jgi:flavin-dependent dehydrogenase